MSHVGGGGGAHHKVAAASMGGSGLSFYYELPWLFIAAAIAMACISLATIGRMWFQKDRP